MPESRGGLFRFYNTMNNEIWKDIEGFNGWYQVSNKARVRSWYKRGIGIGKRKDPVMLKQPTLHGYKYVSLWDENEDRYRSKRVHRLVAKAFIPNPKDKVYINHKNGIKDDNRIGNLEWVTASENDLHAFENGLREPMRGEKNGHAVLTESDILEIRDLCENSELSQKEIGDKFGVCRSHISDIYNGRRWGHV